jgi:hypothetical protein
MQREGHDFSRADSKLEDDRLQPLRFAVEAHSSHLSDSWPVEDWSMIAAEVHGLDKANLRR